MARPTKYTPERVKRLLDAVRLGATFRLACNYAGISHETFSVWRETKSEFSAAVKEAEGTAVVGWLAKIEKAANDGSWQAAAWKAERRYPDDFGRRERIEQTVEVSGHLDTESRDDVTGRIASLAAALRTRGVVSEPDE